MVSKISSMTFMIGLIIYLISQKKTEYDWYVKTHPDFKVETQDIVKRFLRKYNHIRLVPPSTSHHQLINEE